MIDTLTTNATPSGTSIPDEKLLLEIQKLRLEATNLARPWYKTSSTWIAISALAISIATNIFQYSGQEQARQLAEVKKERLELDSERLEIKTKLLNEDAARKLASLNVMKGDLDNHREQLSKLLTDIQDAKMSRADLMLQVKEARKTADQIAAEARRQENSKAVVRSGSNERDSVLDLFKRPPSQASGPTASPASHYVQASAFSDLNSAEKMVGQLAMIGVASEVSKRQQSSKTVYRVILGPFQTRVEAARVLALINERGISVDGVGVDR